MSSVWGAAVRDETPKQSFRLPGIKGSLHARAELPSSKSLTNRALIASAVADGGGIASPLDCADTRNLARALETAGWPVRWDSRIEIGQS